MRWLLVKMFAVQLLWWLSLRVIVGSIDPENIQARALAVIVISLIMMITSLVLLAELAKRLWQMLRRPSDTAPR